MIVLLLPYVLVPLYRIVNPVSTLMLWRWATGARVERSFVPIERMAPALPMTVIASEDGRFCIHRGIDWREIRERLEDVDDISEARGVSTITQQTAKNLFLWPGGGYARKAIEAYFTVLIEAMWTKQRILEMYLNIAEFGPGVYGIEAAARKYLGKPASQLTPADAARLIAVLPSPRHWHAAAPGPYVQSRAAWILGQIGYGAPHVDEAEPEPPGGEAAAETEDVAPLPQPQPELPASEPPADQQPAAATPP